MISELLQHFALDTKEPVVETFGTGLINNTWLVKTKSRDIFYKGLMKMYLSNRKPLMIISAPLIIILKRIFPVIYLLPLFFQKKGKDWKKPMMASSGFLNLMKIHI